MHTQFKVPAGQVHRHSLVAFTQATVGVFTWTGRWHLPTNESDIGDTRTLLALRKPSLSDLSQKSPANLDSLTDAVLA